MDSDKITQLSIRLIELTSAGKIVWNLVDNCCTDDDGGNRTTPLWHFDNPYSGVAPTDQFVYRSVVENKVFRISGGIYRNGDYGKIRLQLWNSEETVLEYEFPENEFFVILFRSVHKVFTTEADKFVDRFLEKSELLEAAG